MKIKAKPLKTWIRSAFALMALGGLVPQLGADQTLHSGFTTITCAGQIRLVARNLPLLPIASDTSTGSKGGQGEVVRALAEDGTTYVAHKTARKDKTEDGLIREAEHLKYLTLRNPPPTIPRFISLRNNTEGRLVLVSEWVEGKTLNEHYHFATNPVTPESFRQQAVGFVHNLRQLYETLNWIHAQGMLHLDVKSKNIIITPQGELRLIDFGIAVKEVSRYENEIHYARPGGFSENVTAPEIARAYNGSLARMSPGTDFFSIGYIAELWQKSLKPGVGADALTIEMRQFLSKVKNFSEPLTQKNLRLRPDSATIDAELRELEDAVSRL